MASKTFYECGCMEQGDQLFRCPAHLSAHTEAAQLAPDYRALARRLAVALDDIDKWAKANRNAAGGLTLFYMLRDKIKALKADPAVQALLED